VARLSVASPFQLSNIEIFVPKKVIQYLACFFCISLNKETKKTLGQSMVLIVLVGLLACVVRAQVVDCNSFKCAGCFDANSARGMCKWCGLPQDPRDENPANVCILVSV
jgi:hypothetical protein